MRSFEEGGASCGGEVVWQCSMPKVTPEVFRAVNYSTSVHAARLELLLLRNVSVDRGSCLQFEKPLRVVNASRLVATRAGAFASLPHSRCGRRV